MDPFYLAYQSTSLIANLLCALQYNAQLSNYTLPRNRCHLIRLNVEFDVIEHSCLTRMHVL